MCVCVCEKGMELVMVVVALVVEMMVVRVMGSQWVFYTLHKLIDSHFAWLSFHQLCF